MPRKVPKIQDVPTPATPLRVVGDIHLCDEEPLVVDGFLVWLAAQEGTGGTVVLLGDVFEMWVAREMQHDPLPKRVLAAIQRVAAAGTEVVYMLGNRDSAFDGADGVDLTLWPDPVRTQLGEQAVVFSHGDQLCTADYGYQAMRRIFYGPAREWLRRMPERTKRWLGEGLRNVSQKETSKKPRYAMGIDYGEALRWMEAYGADAIVAGHVHTGVHHRHAGPPEREILVLKDWERGGSVITWDGGRLIQTAVS